MLNFANNDKYRGFVSNGMLRGEGLYHQARTNKWIHGLFNNETVSAIQQGEG